MRTPSGRAPRGASTLLGAGLLCLAISLGTAPAVAGGHGNGHGHGNGNGNGHRHGNGHGEGKASACPAMMGALRDFHPPFQADPAAGYPVWGITNAPGVENLGFVVEADFPYAAWMSIMTYDAPGVPITVTSDKDFVPEPGSTNPFVVGNSLMAQPRHFRVLALPARYEDNSALLDSLPKKLKSIPNILFLPDAPDDPFFSIIQRVYKHFPGYDQIGTIGPTNTPQPVLTAVDLRKGKAQDCEAISNIPPELRHVTGTPVPFLRLPLPLGVLFPGGFYEQTEALYPPKPDPDLVQFFRPDLASAPYPDVASMPPPDSCAGYMNAKLDDDRIALIRIPQVPTFLNVNDITPGQVMGTPDVKYVSYNTYGSDIGLYRPRLPITMGVNDDDILLDANGGATLVVWPRRTFGRDRLLMFAKARVNGWNLIRGNTDGSVYADSMFIRFKGADPNYGGGFTPNANRPGVPCFTDDPAYADYEYRDLPAQFAATQAEIGLAAPQGVQCSIPEFLGSACLARLRQHISDTGGDYNG
jgi:hypothetical protein